MSEQEKQAALVEALESILHRTAHVPSWGKLRERWGERGAIEFLRSTLLDCGEIAGDALDAVQAE